MGLALKQVSISEGGGYQGNEEDDEDGAGFEDGDFGEFGLRRGRCGALCSRDIELKSSNQTLKLGLLVLREV